MNVATSTLLVLLAVLPGMFLWHAYFSAQFNRRLFGFSPLSELAQYVAIAIPVDAAALWLFQRFQRGEAVSSSFMDLISTPAAQLPGAFEAFLATHGWLVAVLYTGLLFSAYGVGVTLRRLVLFLRLDTRVEVLRPRHPWYYQLMGRLPPFPRRVFPVADVLTEIPGDEGSRLFRGWVDRFQVTEEGDLRELVLLDPVRGKGRGDEFQWVEIPGDQLILRGPTIHSINMHYFEVSRSRRDPTWARGIRASLEWILDRLPQEQRETSEKTA